MAWNSMKMGCAAQRRARPVAAIVLAAAICGAGSGESVNPAAAIASAAGHPARLHLRADATRAQGGQTEIATLEIANGKRLDRVCSGDLCGGTWFDGESLATFGINGTALPDRSGDAEARTFTAIASTAFGEPEFIAGGGTVVGLPVDGAHLRYGVTARRGAELVAVADARTHRLTDVEFPDGREYRALVASTTGSAIIYATRAYDHVVAATDLLAPPAGPNVNVASASEIALLAPDLPIVPCALAGHRLACLIDTGSTPSAVTLEVAEQLDLEPHGHIEIDGLNAYVTGVVDAGPLVLGDTTFKGLRFAVIPRVREARFDVILGSDALSRLCLTFDVRRRRLGVAASGGTVPSRPIALDFAGGVPYAPVRLNTGVTSQAMLVDTADTATLAIGYDEYRTDPTLFTVLGMISAAGIGSGSMAALHGQLAHAQIGSEPLNDVEINAVRGQYTGHVGYGFVTRCDPFILDLGERRIGCDRVIQQKNASTGDP